MSDRRPRGARVLGLARLAALGTITVVLAGCAGLGATAHPSPSANVPFPIPIGPDPHRTAAQRDARLLLASYRPPAGALRLAAAPKGSGVGRAPSSQATTELIDLAGFWRVPGSMVSVLAGARANAPRAWKVTETGESGRNRPGVPPPMVRGHPTIAVVLSRDMTFDLPATRAPLASRQVLVSAAPSSTGAVTMRVDVQLVWVPTRPAWSYVPGPATSATATVWSGAGGTGRRTVTSDDPSTVASLRRLVNAMSVSTTQWTSCPAETGQRFRLVFQVPLAPSVVVSGLTVECGGIQLRVIGRGSLQMTDTAGRVLRATTALARAT